MSRFEKKCFVGSATFHGLLLLVFLFGSAFASKDKYVDIGQVITMTATTTDQLVNTGGNPNVPRAESPPPAPAPLAPPPPAPPQPTPPEPKQEVVKHEEPKTKKEKEPKVKETEKGDLPIKTTSKKESKDTAKDSVAKPSLTKNTVRRSNDVVIAQQRMAAERAAREADRKYQQEVANWKAQQQQLANAVDGVVGGTGRALGKSTVVEVGGPGGEAFVNYGSLVREIYERAWQVSPDLADDDSSATARIIIRRDGSVLSASLYQRSRNASLNRSVQRALDAVGDIGKPFPAGAKEAQRTFTIEFNLKTRRAVG